MLKQGLSLFFIAFGLIASSLAVAATSCPDPTSVKEGQESMKSLTEMLNRLSPAKPKEADQALEQFPCAMMLLSFAQVKIESAKDRIPAMVDLSVATFRFDDTNAAVDTIIYDYMKNVRTYEAEIDRQLKESKRSERSERLNRFLIVLRGYAKNIKEKPEQAK